MVNRHFKTGAAVVLAGALFAAGGMGTATAAKLLDGSRIAPGTVGEAQLGANSVGRSELQPGVVQDGKDGKTGPAGPAGAAGDSGTAGAEGVRGAQGAVGPQGVVGPQGPAGPSGYEGAFYAVAYYNAGDTNAGAIATVACDPTNQNFTAVAGGVQVLGLPDSSSNSRNTPVSSSFPGRMDWVSNTPKVDRLDGWIVQFGGNAGAVSDQAPLKAKIWALCVPRTNIPVVQTYSQVG